MKNLSGIAFRRDFSGTTFSSPAASSPKTKGPYCVRISRATLSPSACMIIRSSRFFPSCRVASIQKLLLSQLCELAVDLLLFVLACFFFVIAIGWYWIPLTLIPSASFAKRSRVCLL